VFFGGLRRTHRLVRYRARGRGRYPKVGWPVLRARNLSAARSRRAIFEVPDAVVRRTRAIPRHDVRVLPEPSRRVPGLPALCHFRLRESHLHRRAVRLPVRHGRHRRARGELGVIAHSRRSRTTGPSVPARPDSSMWSTPKGHRSCTKQGSVLVTPGSHAAGRDATRGRPGASSARGPVPASPRPSIDQPRPLGRQGVVLADDPRVDRPVLRDAHAHEMLEAGVAEHREDLLHLEPA
jgi:hypothetical protein